MKVTGIFNVNSRTNVEKSEGFGTTHTFSRKINKCIMADLVNSKLIVDFKCEATESLKITSFNE